jgi:hypothetical protein
MLRARVLDGFRDTLDCRVPAHSRAVKSCCFARFLVPCAGCLSVCVLILVPLSVLLSELSPSFVRGSVVKGTTWQDVLLAVDACGDIASVGVLVDLFVSITQGVAAAVGSPWFGHDVVVVATGFVTLFATLVVLRALSLDLRAWRLTKLRRPLEDLSARLLLTTAALLGGVESAVSVTVRADAVTLPRISDPSPSSSDEVVSEEHSVLD